MKTPNVHNNWDPLKEVWLGDVWPAHFYDDIKDVRVREAWQQITEWTKEDLSKIQKYLENLGIVVKRPYVDGPKDLYVFPVIDIPGGKFDSTPEMNRLWGKLPKPPITPRDHNAIIGNKLFFSDIPIFNCYKPLILEYDKNSVFLNKENIPTIGGANLVKLGQDLIFDMYIDYTNNLEETIQEIFYKYEFFVNTRLKFLKNDYRIHVATAGGHCDGCFMPIREGLLLASQYYEDYEILFPGWRTICLTEPTYGNEKMGNRNYHKWRVEGLRGNVFPHLNQHIEEFCPDWVGDFTETYFEVNVLMLDEKNMLCMGVHESLFKELEREGITPHVVPFRTRTFWDGGLHCITLDTIRQGSIQDYYPDRGGNGVKGVASKEFKFNSGAFLNAHHDFISRFRDRNSSVQEQMEFIKRLVQQYG